MSHKSNASLHSADLSTHVGGWQLSETGMWGVDIWEWSIYDSWQTSKAKGENRSWLLIYRKQSMSSLEVNCGVVQCGQSQCKVGIQLESLSGKDTKHRKMI